MTIRSVSLKLSAIILIVIGGWFIIASLLPILEIETGYESVTVGGAIMYLYFGLGIDAEILYWLFPVLGVLSFAVGFLLLGGKGRGFGKILYSITLSLAVLGLIIIFAFIGIDTAEGMWGYISEAFKDADIIGALGIVLEPLLIVIGSVVGIILIMIGKAAEKSPK